MFKDAHTIDYGHIQFKRTNITAVRLIDPTSATVDSIITDLEFVKERMDLVMEPFRADTITVNIRTFEREYIAVVVITRTYRTFLGKRVAHVRCGQRVCQSTAWHWRC